MADDLRKDIFTAIFDPGAEVGMKHDRSLSDWQTDAVMNVLDRRALTPSRIGGEGLVAVEWRYFTHWRPLPAPPAHREQVK